MELYKSEFTYGKNSINKFLFDCKRDVTKWFDIVTYLNLYDKNNNTTIFKELWNENKNIVLKIASTGLIKKEYDVGCKLKDMQNFIHYNYIFECDYTIMDILNNKYTKLNFTMENPISILLVDYYRLGNFGEYEWSIYNFHILKNVLKQTVFAILDAYEKYGFIHENLHPGNILLEPLTIGEITYGNKILLIDTYQVVINDFDHSTINNNNKNDFTLVIDSCKQLLNSLSIIDNENIKIICDIIPLSNIKYDTLTKIKHYDELEKIIDNIKI